MLSKKFLFYMLITIILLSLLIISMSIETSPNVLMGFVASESVKEITENTINNNNIHISDAEHLDINRNFISNIYDETKEKDDVWSETINNQEYVRVTFERNLTSKKDITIYPKISNGNTKVEVYEFDGTELIAEFTNLNSNEYNKIFLTNLISESQDVFDLKIIGGSIELDHIIDPPTQRFFEDCQTPGALTDQWVLISGGADVEWQYGIGGNANKCYAEQGVSTIISIPINLSDADIDHADLNFTWDCDKTESNEGLTVSVNSSSEPFQVLFWSAGNETGGTENHKISDSITLDASVHIKVNLSTNANTEDCTIDDINVTSYPAPEIPPDINITFPALNNTNTTDTGYDVNYSASDDIALSVCWWTQDGGTTNNTLASCTTNITGETWTEGLNTIRVYANDTSDNINSSEITFRLDTTPPDLNITFPALNNTNTTDTGYDINYTASDNGVGLSVCWWTQDGGSTNNTLASCTTNITGQTWTEGLNTIKIYSNDTLDNVNNSQITFRLDTTVPNFKTANLSLFSNQTGDPLLDFNATDNGIGAISGFSINWTSTFSMTYGDGNLTNTSALAEGNYWINASVNDTLGNTNYTLILVNITDSAVVDNINPDINITFPALNGTNTTDTGYDVNYSASDDIALSVCWWTQDGGTTNNTLASCTTNITGETWSEGLNTIRVYANDTSDNINSSEITFRLDTTPPDLNITFPALNNTNTTDTGYDINYTAFDDVALSVCWWTQDGGSTNNTLASCTTNITGETWSEGLNTIRVYANDTSDNVNNSEIVFRLDTTPPALNITFPALNGTNTTDTGYDINYTASDDVALSVCWWTRDGGTTNTTLASCTTNITGETWSEGLNTIRVYSNDTLDNVNNSEIVFRLDTTVPDFKTANLSVLTNETTTPLLDFNATDNGIGTISGFAINWTSTFAITFVDGNITNTSAIIEGNYWINASVNDTLGNTNYTLILINVTDATAPDLKNPDIDFGTLTEANGSNLSQNFIYVNVTVTEVNEDAIVFNLYYNNGTSVNSTAYTDSTRTINWTNLDDNNYEYNVTVNDTAGNTNTTDTRTITLDANVPIFTSATETPTDSPTYSSGVTYEFNITIKSTNSTAGIEFDNVNYTISNLTVDIYNWTTTDLSVGTFNYYYWAYGNGTSNNYNSSKTYSYTINEAIPNGTISGTTPITFGTAGDVQGSETNANDGDVGYTLYRNDTTTTVSNPDTTTLGAGWYNYTWNATAGTNYTSNASIATLTLEVQQATSDVNLTLNNSDQNITITTGDKIDLNCSTLTGDLGATLNLYQEESLINSNASAIGNSTTFNTMQVENITCIYSNTQNYTTSFETWWVNVTEDNTPPEISITFPLNITYSTNVSNLNYTYSDSNPDSCWNSIDGGSTNSSSVSAGTNFTNIVSNAGDNNWTLYCNDTIGNENSTSITFIKDTTSPVKQVPPSGGSGRRNNIIAKKICESNYTCKSWSFCSANFTQRRICTDLNNCRNESNKPKEIRECPNILFDSIVELNTKKIYPWKELSFIVNLKEVNSSDLVDIKVIYRISKNKVIVYEESETRSIKDELIYEKKIVGLDLNPGDYSLSLIIQYGKDQTASAEQNFSVIGSTSIIISIIILFLIIILTFVSYNWYKSRKHEEIIEKKLAKIEEKLEEKQPRRTKIKNWMIKKMEVVRLKSLRKRKENPIDYYGLIKEITKKRQKKNASEEEITKENQIKELFEKIKNKLMVNVLSTNIKRLLSKKPKKQVKILPITIKKPLPEEEIKKEMQVQELPEENIPITIKKPIYENQVKKLFEEIKKKSKVNVLSTIIKGLLPKKPEKRVKLFPTTIKKPIYEKQIKELPEENIPITIKKPLQEKQVQKLPEEELKKRRKKDAN